MEMVNKFFTLSLGFLILISLIGVPFTLHVCEKLGLTFKDNCQICENVREIEESCCDSDDLEPFNHIFTGFNHHCCKLIVHENKIDDRLLPGRLEQETLLSKINQVILITFIPPQTISFELKHSNLGLSPPYYNQVNLNILFSVFLI